MPVKHRPRVPALPRPHHPRRTPPRANPLFGYGYNPSLPSVLSIAHDEEDGGALFVIMDRPCALAGAGNVIPLTVAGLSVLSGAMIAPIKFRFGMNGPVPRGAAWQWGTGPTNLFDAVTGLGPNAGAGDCADTPGPYVPPPPASVVSAYAGGTTAVLVFDRPVEITGGPVDDAITFNGMTPASVVNADATSLSFALPGFVNAGEPWAIGRQPDWLVTPVAWPAGGVL